MSYDVKAKHGELIDLLSEQYKAYSDAGGAFFRAEHDREWERYQVRKDTRIVNSEMAMQDMEEDLAWEASNEDKKKMDEAAIKLHKAVKYIAKHYSYWHASRIRVASGIHSTEWLMFMTPICLPSWLSMDSDDKKEGDDWKQAMDLADNFTAEEFKSMSARKYAYEVFRRTNNLLDMKQAQAVG